MKNCSNPNCEEINPQPFENFQKDKRHPTGFLSQCKKCKTNSSFLRNEYKKKLDLFSEVEKNIIISCLYITMEESISRLKNLFEFEEDKIINILKEEEVFEYAVCKNCNKLKPESEFTENKKSNSRKIDSNCKICNTNIRKEKNKEFVNYKSVIKRFEDIKSINAEEFRSFSDDPEILEARCNYCGRWYKPQKAAIDLRINALKGLKNGCCEARLYCSNACKNSCPIFGKPVMTMIKEDKIRSGFLDFIGTQREVQPQLRKIVLERDNYICVKCKITQDESEGLHCHHIIPVVYDKIISADVDNCITLCIKCHKKVHTQDGCRISQLKEAAAEICLA